MRFLLDVKKAGIFLAAMILIRSSGIFVGCVTPCMADELEKKQCAFRALAGHSGFLPSSNKTAVSSANQSCCVMESSKSGALLTVSKFEGLKVPILNGALEAALAASNPQVPNLADLKDGPDRRFLLSVVFLPVSPQQAPPTII